MTRKKNDLFAVRLPLFWCKVYGTMVPPSAHGRGQKVARTIPHVHVGCGIIHQITRPHRPPHLTTTTHQSGTRVIPCGPLQFLHEGISLTDIACTPYLEWPSNNQKAQTVQQECRLQSADTFPYDVSCERGTVAKHVTNTTILAARRPRATGSTERGQRRSVPHSGSRARLPPSAAAPLLR